MSEEQSPGGGPPKSGVSTQQPRPKATKPADTTGTLSFGEPSDSDAPPKSGVSTQQPRPEPSNNQEEPKK